MANSKYKTMHQSFTNNGKKTLVVKDNTTYRIHEVAPGESISDVSFPANFVSSLASSGEVDITDTTASYIIATPEKISARPTSYCRLGAGLVYKVLVETNDPDYKIELPDNYSLVSRTSTYFIFRVKSQGQSGSIKLTAQYADKAEATASITVEVTSASAPSTTLSVSPTSFSLTEGDSQVLSINTNASDYSYTISDDSIISFDKEASKVTALKAGNANLVFTAQAGYTSATVTVSITVVAKTAVLKGISVTTNPTKMSYYVGDAFDKSGMAVTATYDDGSTAIITDYTYSPSTLSNVGSETITISYGGKSTELVVEVIALVITGIEIETQPSKLSYLVNESVDLTGLVIKATYNSGATELITSGYTYSPESFSSTGTQTVVISYAGFSVNLSVEVSDQELTTLNVSPSSLNMFVGETKNISVESNAESISTSTGGSGVISTSQS